MRRIFLEDGDVFRWKNTIEMYATERGVEACTELDMFRKGDSDVLRENFTVRSCFTKTGNWIKIPVAGIHYLFNDLVTNWKMIVLALARAGSLYLRSSKNNSHKLTEVNSTCTSCLTK
jgi:hypothetical protein